jgi:hypothetical protein
VGAIHLSTAVGRPTRSTAIPWAASPEEDPFRAPSGASVPSMAADRTEMVSPYRICTPSNTGIHGVPSGAHIGTFASIRDPS